MARRRRKLRVCAACEHAREAHNRNGKSKACNVGHEAIDASQRVAFGNIAGTVAEVRAALGLPTPCPCPGYTTKKEKPMPTIPTKKVTERIDVDGARVRRVLCRMREAFTSLAAGVDELLEEIGPSSVPPILRDVSPPSHVEASRAKPARRVYEDESSRELAAAALGTGPRALLTVIAQYDGKATRDTLIVVTGYRSTSIRTYLGELTGCFERNGPHGNATCFTITQAGLVELGGNVPARATVDELLEEWQRRLGEGPAAILALVAAAGTIDKRTIEEQSGYKATSVRTYVGELVAAKLVRNERGMVRLSPWLGGSS